ncbi:MAG: cadmium-translocating P-type ATPase [Alphaproteobacteria bacterium]|nr:cadmium-translocating P-type ATPase [Alphaproteobacteria bacterium]
MMTDYSGFIRQERDGRQCLRLAVEGMNCAGCAFKIEKALNANENVEARVNVTEKRLTLIWSGDTATGNGLVEKAAALGFRFSPVREKEDGGDDQARLLLRCMAVAGFASGNLMIFSLALWFSTRESMGATTRDLMYWYSALIALPAVVYAGQPFFKSAWRALSHGRTNMDVPISVAVILASAMSLFETVRGGAHVYFDSAVMLLFLLLVGRYLDVKARAQTRHAAADLLSLMNGTATVVQDGVMVRLPAEEIKPGMLLLVAKGEKILADGIAQGEAVVDSSALTGETLPQAVQAGGRLLAGMINLGNPVQLRADKSQNDSLMGDIIELMQKAEQGNAAYVRLADRIAGWYTPVVHALALAAFIGWWGFGGASWQLSLLYAITVLVITCPCALGLAVPVAQVVAGSHLFRKGMLLKSGDALERLEKVDTVIFDKTGTLTTGNIVFENRADFTGEELSLITALAGHSRHPLARAAATTANENISVAAREIEGEGMEGRYQGETLRLGSAAFLGAAPDENDEKMGLWFSAGKGAPKRLIFSDVPHADAAETVAQLKKKYRVLMLSGDRLPVARAIAGRLGIEVFQAGVDPRQKFAIIDAEINRGRRVLMVGDGLNDAAALSRASVSMSPSSALDIAQNAADIVYQQKGIASVLAALETARKTQKIVRQNFALALGYNVIAIPLAMAGHVTPLVAAVAMSSSSLFVICNALRLKGEQGWIS